MQSVRYQLPHYGLQGLQWGNPNGQVVLFIHGWLDNAASFIPLIENLVNQQPQFNYLAIDLPGHGLSDWRNNDAYYHFVEWVNDLDNLVNQIANSPLVIVGHSMGAMIAGAYAACFSDKVQKLVQLEGIGFITTPEEKAVSLLREAIESRQQLLLKPEKVHSSFESALRARAAVADLPAEALRGIVERGTKQTTQGVVWRSDPKLKLTSAWRLSTAQANQFVSEIKCDVLFIDGASGYDFVKQNYQHYSPYYARLTRQTVVGGHHFHLQSQQQTADAILTFLCDK